MVQVEIDSDGKVVKEFDPFEKTSEKNPLTKLKSAGFAANVVAAQGQEDIEPIEPREKVKNEKSVKMLRKSNISTPSGSGSSSGSFHKKGSSKSLKKGKSG